MHHLIRLSVRSRDLRVPRESLHSVRQRHSADNLERSQQALLECRTQSLAANTQIQQCTTRLQELEAANQALQVQSQRNRDDYNSCIQQTDVLRGEKKGLEDQYTQSKQDFLTCNAQVDANNLLRQQQDSRVQTLETENANLRTSLQRASMCEARMQMHVQQLGEMQRKYSDLMNTASMALNDAQQAVPPPPPPIVPAVVPPPVSNQSPTPTTDPSPASAPTSNPAPFSVVTDPVIVAPPASAVAATVPADAATSPNSEAPLPITNPQAVDAGRGQSIRF